MARVGPKAITSREARDFQSENPDMLFAEAVDALVKQRLVLAWGAENGVRVGNSELEKIVDSIRRKNNLTEEKLSEALSQQGMSMDTFREKIRDQVAASRAASMAMGERLKPSQDDIRKIYEEQYHESTSVTVRHILLAVKKDAPDALAETVKEKAFDLLARIRAGKPFEEAAAEFSEDPSTASKGGFLGTFGEGELLPELEKAVEKMSPGEVGGPVRTPAGFHLIQLVKRDTVLPPSMDDVRAELVKKWKTERRGPEMDKWLGELRKKYYTEIFTD